MTTPYERYRESDRYTDDVIDWAQDGGFDAVSAMYDQTSVATDVFDEWDAGQRETAERGQR